MMYNQQQQQYAGIAPQGGFNPGTNPQMMQGMPAGMMQSPGMSSMPANGQSEWPFFLSATPMPVYRASCPHLRKPGDRPHDMSSP